MFFLNLKSKFEKNFWDEEYKLYLQAWRLNPLANSDLRDSFLSFQSP